MSRWFRHYAGMARDDKLVRAALRSKQTIERVVWIWSAVLESAAEFDDEGRYEVDVAEMAHFLRCKPAAIEAILEALKHLERIDDSNVTAWAKRQFKSDRSNDRVATHRAKRKRSGNDDETLHVTLPERDGNSPELETETETEVREGSVAKATAQILPLVDPEKAVFDSGIAYLATCGVQERRSRPILAKWKRDQGSGAVIEALGAAQRQGAIDPISWIEARWSQRTRQAAEQLVI